MNWEVASRFISRLIESMTGLDVEYSKRVVIYTQLLELVQDLHMDIQNEFFILRDEAYQAALEDIKPELFKKKDK